MSYTHFFKTSYKLPHFDVIISLGCHWHQWILSLFQVYAYPSVPLSACPSQMTLLLWLFKDFRYQPETWWDDAQYHEQTSHLSVYIRRNPYFNHFLRGISVFGYYPYFSVFCINCRLINRNPQLTLCSWTVPRTHAWAGTIVRPLPGELRPRGPIHVTPLGSIITNTATPLRNIESAQCRMRRHRIPV